VGLIPIRVELDCRTTSQCLLRIENWCAGEKKPIDCVAVSISVSGVV
jgi:hypothetical protein